MKRGQNLQKFSCRTHQYLPGGLKRGKESKIAKRFSCRKHQIFDRKPKKKKIRHILSC